jgi:hypothetical protein
VLLCACQISPQEGYLHFDWSEDGMNYVSYSNVNNEIFLNDLSSSNNPVQTIKINHKGELMGLTWMESNQFLTLYTWREMDDYTVPISSTVISYDLSSSTQNQIYGIKNKIYDICWLKLEQALVFTTVSRETFRYNKFYEYPSRAKILNIYYPNRDFHIEKLFPLGIEEIDCDSAQNRIALISETNLEDVERIVIMSIVDDEIIIDTKIDGYFLDISWSSGGEWIAATTSKGAEASALGLNLYSDDGIKEIIYIEPRKYDRPSMVSWNNANNLLLIRYSGIGKPLDIHDISDIFPK